MKRCSQCKVTKPLADFRRDKRVSTGLHSWCKVCFRAKEKVRYVVDGERIRTRNRERYRRNPETSRERERTNYHLRKTEHRNNRLARVFGLSANDYAALLEKQNHVCAICGRPETQLRGGVIQNLSVDHDHGTDMVRGLLCSGCNMGLGHFEDSPQYLTSALTYLQYWSARDDIV